MIEKFAPHLNNIGTNTSELFDHEKAHLRRLEKVMPKYYKWMTTTATILTSAQAASIVLGFAAYSAQILSNVGVALSSLTFLLIIVGFTSLVIKDLYDKSAQDRVSQRLDETKAVENFLKDSKGNYYYRVNNNNLTKIGNELKDFDVFKKLNQSGKTTIINSDMRYLAKFSMSFELLFKHMEDINIDLNKSERAEKLKQLVDTDMSSTKKCFDDFKLACTNLKKTAKKYKFENDLSNIETNVINELKYIIKAIEGNHTKLKEPFDLKIIEAVQENPPIAKVTKPFATMLQTLKNMVHDLAYVS